MKIEFERKEIGSSQQGFRAVLFVEGAFERDENKN
jgi:hypothetical protein